MCKLANPTSQSPGPSFIGVFSTLVKSVGDWPLLCNSRLRPCSLSKLSREDMSFRFLTEDCKSQVPTMALYILWYHASSVLLCLAVVVVDVLFNWVFFFLFASPPPVAGGRGRRRAAAALVVWNSHFPLRSPPHWCETYNSPLSFPASPSLYFFLG